MSKTKTGGPAFPTESYSIGRDAMVREEGMTLRDYFAAKAMQGLLSSNFVSVNLGDMPEVAKDAYEIADAMLKAREQ